MLSDFVPLELFFIFFSLKDFGVDLFVAGDHFINSEILFHALSALIAVDSINLTDSFDSLIDILDQITRLTIGDDLAARA